MSALLDKKSGQAMLALLLCLLTGVLWKLVPNPAIAVLAGILPIGILFVLRQPFLMVLLFVIFSFFRIHEVFPQLYSLKIPLLLSMAALTALVWHVGLTRKVEAYWRTELTMLALFFGLVIVGILMASNRPVAVNYFTGIYWKISIMTVAIAWLSRTSSDFRLASRLITLAGLAVAIVALYNKSMGIGLVEGTRVTIGREIGSVLGDPNDLALVLMFPASFAVSLIATQGIGKSSRLLGLLAFIALFLAVIATQSRGGLLGIMAVLGIYAYRRMQSKTLFMVLGGIAVMLLYTIAGISDRASGGSAEEGIDASAMGRLYAWEAAFGMAVDNPLTGVGLNNFFPNYFFYSPHWDGLNHAVHSTWFGVLAETGFLGLVVFVIAIVILIHSAYRSLRRIEEHRDRVAPDTHATAQAVFAGMIGTVVSGTFLTQGFTWPIYILAALIIAVARWTDNHLGPENTPRGHSHQTGDVHAK